MRNILAVLLVFVGTLNALTQNRIIYAIGTDNGINKSTRLTKYDFSLSAANPINTIILPDIFQYVPQGQGGFRDCDAIALDPYNNLLYFINRRGSTTSGIYALDLNDPTQTRTIASLPQGPGLVFDRAAFNPVDRRLYFGTSLGAVFILQTDQTIKSVGFAPNTGFPINGDMVFDALGNMIYSTYVPGEAQARTFFFPAQYDINGTYNGVSFTKFLNNIASPVTYQTGLAFDANGGLFTSRSSMYPNAPITSNRLQYTGPLEVFNYDDGDMGDLASGYFPGPKISTFSNTAVVNCASLTVQFSIDIENKGTLFAANPVLIDTLPDKVSIVSGSINGKTIAGLSRQSLMDGVALDSLLISNAPLNIKIICTYDEVIQTTNTAYLKYEGLASEGTAQLASNPATLISCASLPVIFGQIYGTLDDDVLRINWNVQKEERGGYYEVELSKNGTDFYIYEKVLTDLTLGGNYKLEKNIKARVLNLWAIALIFVSFFGYRRFRLKRLVSYMVLFGCLLFAQSCAKNESVLIADNGKLFFRVKYTDNKGGVAYSKIGVVTRAE
ncbi:MAG: hypothetical protein J7599_13395 [Niabella sp.]|nr:hypothetical protein [Niabella sp.]